MTTETEEGLGKAIRQARRRTGLTQSELGEFAGADRFAIAAIERGKFTTQVQRLLAVIDAVGLELTLTPRTLRLTQGNAEDMPGAVHAVASVPPVTVAVSNSGTETAEPPATDSAEGPR